jgi:hypothetical protein
MIVINGRIVKKNVLMILSRRTLVPVVVATLMTTLTAMAHPTAMMNVQMIPRRLFQDSVVVEIPTLILIRMVMPTVETLALNMPTRPIQPARVTALVRNLRPILIRTRTRTVTILAGKILTRLILVSVVVVFPTMILTVMVLPIVRTSAKMTQRRLSRVHVTAARLMMTLIPIPFPTVMMPAPKMTRSGCPLVSVVVET